MPHFPQMAYGGQRISITFRWITTFKNAKGIYGQGSPFKSEAELDAYLTTSSPEEISRRELNETEELIDAFGWENQCPFFDWDKAYGKGFKVIDMSRRNMSSTSQVDI